MARCLEPPSVLFGAWPVSVVVATLQELDPVGFNQVNTAMLLRNTSGPNIRTEIFQQLGLADANEGGEQNGLNQVQQPLFGPAVSLDLVLQVL